MNEAEGRKTYVPDQPSESIMNVRVSVSPNDGYEMMNVVACVVSLRWNLYQSVPSPKRSCASNASAGFKNKTGASTVPGHGPPASRSMNDGCVSFGSYTSSGLTSVLSVANPNTPAPR